MFFFLESVCSGANPFCELFFSLKEALLVLPWGPGASSFLSRSLLAVLGLFLAPLWSSFFWSASSPLEARVPFPSMRWASCRSYWPID